MPFTAKCRYLQRFSPHEEGNCREGPNNLKVLSKNDNTFGSIKKSQPPKSGSQRKSPRSIPRAMFSIGRLDNPSSFEGEVALSPELLRSFTTPKLHHPLIRARQHMHIPFRKHQHRQP